MTGMRGWNHKVLGNIIGSLHLMGYLNVLNRIPRKIVAANSSRFDLKLGLELTLVLPDN